MKLKKKNIFVFSLILAFLAFITFFAINTSNNDSRHKNIDISRLEVLSEITKLPDDLPTTINNNSDVIKINLVTKEVVSNITGNTTMVYWTYNNTVPGPFLRIREGDTVELSLTNDKTSNFHHSIDLHAVTGPGGGATLTQVGAGQTKSIRFKALNPGLYVYHCATPDVPHHVANGMYGLILVEPKEGLEEVDKEFYVMQGEFYLKDKINDDDINELDNNKILDENPSHIVFNGKVGALTENSLKAEIGDKIRIFVGNGGISKISSFHIIGEIFDRVYSEAATNMYLENVQTTIVPAGGASIVELTLDYPGDFILVDHALARLNKGAFGLLQVEGEKNEEVFS